MALKAGRVGVAPDQVDNRGKVTGAGLTPEQKAKLDSALQAPEYTVADAGKVLKVNAAGNDVEWSDPPSGGVTGHVYELDKTTYNGISFNSDYTKITSGGSLVGAPVPSDLVGKPAYLIINCNSSSSSQLPGGTVFAGSSGITEGKDVALYKKYDAAYPSQAVSRPDTFDVINIPELPAYIFQDPNYTNSNLYLYA